MHIDPSKFEGPGGPRSRSDDIRDDDPGRHGNPGLDSHHGNEPDDPWYGGEDDNYVPDQYELPIRFEVGPNLAFGPGCDIRTVQRVVARHYAEWMKQNAELEVAVDTAKARIVELETALAYANASREALTRLTERHVTAGQCAYDEALEAGVTPMHMVCFTVCHPAGNSGQWQFADLMTTEDGYVDIYAKWFRANPADVIRFHGWKVSTDGWHQLTPIHYDIPKINLVAVQAGVGFRHITYDQTIPFPEDEYGYDERANQPDPRAGGGDQKVPTDPSGGAADASSGDEPREAN